MQTPTLEGKPALVVIVDDQSTGRKILEQLVGSIDANIDVIAFGNALSALEQIRVRTPDLILTDYKMPGMDGISFTRQVRGIDGCADVPLIMVTIVEDRRVRYEALDAGATDFLNRPVDEYECRARCRNLLLLRDQQKLIRDRARLLEAQVDMATREIQARERETLLRLAKAGEYRDEGTGNHVLRMASYCRLMAEALELPPRVCAEIELAAPMHDIGKIGIPDGILLKPGRLDALELDIMRGHAMVGYEILKDSPSRYLQLRATIARSHNERYDGSGYPEGLSGEAIPLAARIVAVADVFDALTTTRPYKPAWSVDEAVAYLRTHAETHFDPRCVDAFLRCLDEIRVAYRELPDDEQAVQRRSWQAQGSLATMNRQARR
jgi:two-component system response regulator RpfG